MFILTLNLQEKLKVKIQKVEDSINNLTVSQSVKFLITLVMEYSDGMTETHLQVASCAAVHTT